MGLRCEDQVKHSFRPAPRDVWEAAIFYGVERQLYYELGRGLGEVSRPLGHWGRRMEQIALKCGVGVEEMREILEVENLPLLLGRDSVMDRYIARELRVEV